MPNESNPSGSKKGALSQPMEDLPKESEDWMKKNKEERRERENQNEKSKAGLLITGMGSPLGTTSENQFAVGATSFRTEPTSPQDPYYTLQSRKFIILF